MAYTCPVCGFPDLEEPPHSEDGGGSYEHCPSCGFEFGFHDDAAGWSYEAWRQKWVDEGMPWRVRSIPRPRDWDPVRQLKKLLEEPSS